MKSFIYAATLLASSTYGHIQMSNPFPIRSPLNPNGAEPKDYSYTNPLSTSGSDYPCKGYHTDPFKSVATYAPGSEYDLELQGSAVHGGGSCQIALSYDQGESFSVIHSMLGGCPITKSYKFTIPTDAPSGEALLAWSWFNKVGNREMYMNCAQVTIGSAARMEGFTAIAQSSAFSGLPPLFIANVNGPGQCTTVEGEEVNFPLPGPSVEGSLTSTGYKCTGSAPFLASSNSPNDDEEEEEEVVVEEEEEEEEEEQDRSTSTSSTSARPTSTSSASTSTPLIQSPMTFSSSSVAAPSASASPSGTTTAAVEASSLSSSLSSSSSTPVTVPTERPLLPVAGGPDGSCSPGTILCSEDGSSWWLCDQGVPVHMGLVAPGTHCVHGAMQRAQ